MKIKFSQPRKWSFPFNIVIFNICRLVPFRNKRLWVFGSLEGKKYDDNSKYLFEYVIKVHPEIRAVWITGSYDALSVVKDKGYEVYSYHSLKGKWIELRAGVSFYTHGLIDFGLFPLIGGSMVVSLWHGVGFKKIYNSKYRGKTLKVKKSVDRLFSWTYRNLTMVTSDYTFTQFQNLFNLNPKEIYITGQPRNNELKKTIDRRYLLSELGVEDSKKIILYMPTYRSEMMGKDELRDIILDLYNNKDLDDFLTANHFVFITKLHPLTQNPCLTDRKNFKILDFTRVSNTQQLLLLSDIMVTDYSSCFVDFSLLRRPIVFYTPDEKEFVEKSEQMDDDFFRICHMCNASSVEELISLLKAPSLIISNETNKIFCSQDTDGTDFCQNVFNIVYSKVR